MGLKIDLKKEQKHLYAPSAKEVTLVEVPGMDFLMADGAGDPNTSPDFQAAVEALYSLSYALKFMVKKGQGIDYAVLPLEGLWWAEDMEAFNPESLDKDRWQWTLMIRQPEQVTPELFGQALGAGEKEKAPPLSYSSSLGKLGRGSVRPDFVRRAFCGRTYDYSKNPCFRQGPRLPVGRQASRDLFERSPQDRPGKTEDYHPAASTKELTSLKHFSQRLSASRSQPKTKTALTERAEITEKI